jgi:dachs protein
LCIYAAILNNAIRHATDGFIGVLDMFGFEDSRPSQLEQLCINLCSETMQHFFNTHTLKTAIGIDRYSYHVI